MNYAGRWRLPGWSHYGSHNRQVETFGVICIRVRYIVVDPFIIYLPQDTKFQNYFISPILKINSVRLNHVLYYWFFLTTDDTATNSNNLLKILIVLLSCADRVHQFDAHQRQVTHFLWLTDFIWFILGYENRNRLRPIIQQKN